MIKGYIRRIIAIIIVVGLLALIGHYLWLNFGLSQQMQETIENLTSIG
jgi:type VI protein secretion system component VasF